MRAWMGAWFVVVLGASQCTPSEEQPCDDCFGYVDVSWTFRGPGGLDVACPESITGVEVRATLKSDPGKTWSQVFPCTPQAATMTLDGGEYDLLLATRDSDGEVARSESLPVMVPILGARVAVTWEFLAP